MLMKIAIAGYGVEGQASYEYYTALGDEVVIVDEHESVELPENVESILGADAFNRLEEFDLIVRSPGIAPKKLPYGDKVWSSTNEFFTKCPAFIIGVTGTKGKGTTASLIASILRAGNKTVHLVGNIGVPALQELNSIQSEDIVVFELSSFQLWDLEKSPNVAVVLMIEPDHLDVHDNFEDYVAAKMHITEYQTTTDRVFFNDKNEISTLIAAQSVGQRLPYANTRTAHVQREYFYYQDTELCSVDELQIPGEHNKENACAAITAAWPWVQDSDVIAQGLRSFSGLPHRLKFIREVSGVRYYDDSIATTTGSAMAALRAFDETKTVILGGSDKGGGYDEVVQLAKETGTKVIAIGQTGEQIHRLCIQVGVASTRVERGMAEVVEAAAQVAQPGEIVILSPASASFDQYKSYADRGQQFIAAVNSLASGVR